MSRIALPIAELKPALVGLGKIIGRKNGLPVLNHVLVERTTDGWIRLTATDLDRCATVRLEQPAEGEPCSMLIPYEDLQKTAKPCTKTDIIVLEKTGKESLTIHFPIGQQTVKNKIATLPVDEFPPFPAVESGSVTLPENLRTSIHEALGCASDDPTRFILNGVFIDVTDEKCHHVVGTNGRILYSSNSFSLPLGKSVTIPSHPFLTWKEFNHDGEWKMRTKTTDQQLIEISTRRWTYISKQIEGQYPDWRQVIPEANSFHTTIVLDEQTLGSIVQIIDRLPNYDERDFTIGLKMESKRFCLLGKSAADVQWTEVDVPFTKAYGKIVTIYLNRSFLSTALSFGLNKIEIIDEMSPLRLCNGGRQVIISPCRADVAPTVEQTSQPAVASAETKEEQPLEKTPPPEEQKPMIHEEKATEPAPEEPPASEIDQVIETIEDLRESLSTNLADLKTVTGKLKQMKKDQKNVDREIHSFRQTLKNLQGVRL